MLQVHWECDVCIPQVTVLASDELKAHHLSGH